MAKRRREQKKLNSEGGQESTLLEAKIRSKNLDQLWYSVHTQRIVETKEEDKTSSYWQRFVVHKKHLQEMRTIDEYYCLDTAVVSGDIMIVLSKIGAHDATLGMELEFYDLFVLGLLSTIYLRPR